MATQRETTDSPRSKLEEIFKDGSQTTDLNPEIWLKDLRDKIYSMFRTPLREEYNEEAFKWISALCMCQPRFSWLCLDPKSWTKEEAKMFSLIARLSINEIHILLPYIRRHLISGEEVALEDGKVMARPAKAEEYSNFGVHLLIFEETICSLVHGQDDEERDNLGSGLTDLIDPNELKSLLERLKEIVGELLDYLEDVHNNWTTLMREPESQKFQAAQGALRAISVWMSEDTGSFQEQCKRFLIQLIIKNLLVGQDLQETNLDILVMALHSICSGEQDMKGVLEETSEFRAALQKYLDHVQQQLNESTAKTTKRDERRKEKQFKLQCGLVKDLLK